MKTHKVRPVLVETKENTGITLGINITRNIPGVFRGQNYQLILISLEDKKIEVGDKYYSLETKEIDILREDELPMSYDRKVVATQDQLSPELIQQLVDEYNNGDMKDFEIEMEEYGVCEVCSKQGYRHCAYPEECGNVKILNRPKLTNGFVTGFEKEPILYTEEEVFALLVASHSEVGKTLIKNIGLRKWFEQNKKK